MKKRILFYVVTAVSITNFFVVDADLETSGNFTLNGFAEGNNKVLDAFLAGGGDINFQDELGVGFLHVAVVRGDVNKVEELLAQGANPNIQTKTGIAPLHIACSIPALNVIHFNTWMKSAPKMVRDLLAARANPNIKTDLGLTPLHMNSSTLLKNDDISQLGIRMPKKIGERTVSVVLHTVAAVASAQAAIYVVTVIPAVAAASSTSFVGIVIVAAVGGAASSVITIKVLNQIRIKMVRARLLLEHGANVNATDNFGNTALHYLAIGRLKDVGLKGRRGAVLLAKRLKNAGANVSLKNNSGHTAYDIAKTNRRILLQPLLNPNVPWTRPLKKLLTR